MTSTKKIVVVNSEAMLNDSLYRAEKFAPRAKVQAMLEAISNVVSERRAFESTKERMIDGYMQVGQSPDIKHVENLANNEAVARLFVALKVDPRAYIHPASKDGGKLSTETSSLKAYKKTLEIAETVWSGSSTLENVVKVWTACAFIATTKGKLEVLDRKFSEGFLNSWYFKTITQGSADFMEAVEEVRSISAKQMSGGCKTQTSQMIRTLVALGSATDVQEGRNKNTAIHPDGRVIQALMRRFGQVTDIITPEQELAETDNDSDLLDGMIEQAKEDSSVSYAMSDDTDSLLESGLVTAEQFLLDTVD